MANIVRLIFLCVIAVMSHAIADSSAPDHFKNIQIAIPAKMRGWSVPKPPGTGPTLTYQGKGISFITSSDGKMSSAYTWTFDQSAPSSAEYQNDPLKMVQYITYLFKKGDHAGVMKWADPKIDALDLATLNRPDIIKNDLDIYADATGCGILLAVEDGHVLLVYYYIQKPSRKVLQMESLRNLGSSYVLGAHIPDQSDSMPINVFTALYDTLHGISKDIEITP